MLSSFSSIADRGDNLGRGGHQTTKETGEIIYIYICIVEVKWGFYSLLVLTTVILFEATKTPMRDCVASVLFEGLKFHCYVFSFG